MMKINFWKITDDSVESLNFNTSTLADTSKFTPEGAYTTFRTYNAYGVLRLTKHLDRLEETSRLAGYTIHLDRERLKKILCDKIAENLPGEKRVRLTVDLTREVGTIYTAMEELVTPDPKFYRTGIICVTTEAHRDNPKAKLSSFLSRAEHLRSLAEGDYQEMIMHTEDGKLLEGLSSNFYAVMQGTIYTANEGVLSGTTRDFILKIAGELGIPVCLEPADLKNIPLFDEAFISSTSRSVLPIQTIDAIPMCQSVPGPVTAALMERFNAELADGIESLK